MLPAAHRMRSSEEFLRTIRSGVRVGSSSLVLHARPGPGTESTQVGLVVSRAVGNAVTRNRVKRRLRHLLAHEVAQSPTGLRLVVRALPSAAADPGRLSADLDQTWHRVRRRLDPGAR